MYYSLFSRVNWNSSYVVLSPCPLYSYFGMYAIYQQQILYLHIDILLPMLYYGPHKLVFALNTNIYKKHLAPLSKCLWIVK